MTFRDEEIHPILWRATDALNARWNSGATKGAEETAVVMRHGSLWSKRYGWGCLARMLPLLAAFPAAIAFKEATGLRGVFPLAILAGLAVVSGVLCYQMYKENLRTVGAEELENLLPILELDPVGRAYAETVLALSKSNVPEAEAKETLAALNRVLDEAERLETAVGPETPTDDLDAERTRLEGLRDGTDDAGAREMYEESLRLLEARRRGRPGAGGRARADAQRELLRQTVLAVRDALVRPAVAETVAPDVRELMARVADVRREADATARAAEEIRAL